MRDAMVSRIDARPPGKTSCARREDVGSEWRRPSQNTSALPSLRSRSDERGGVARPKFAILAVNRRLSQSARLGLRHRKSFLLVCESPARRGCQSRACGTPIAARRPHLSRAAAATALQRRAAAVARR